MSQNKELSYNSAELQMFHSGDLRIRDMQYLALNKFADCFVVKVLDFLPWDSLLYIFLLRNNLQTQFK